MFGGFPGMDGIGRGGGRRRQVDNTKYYKLLGVDTDASVSQIKKAYRKLAMTHHPDKGGDEERFKEITTAFEVLSDEEKKAIYDEYGEEGLADGGGGSANPGDIFEAVFGGGGGMFGRQSRGPKKGEDVVHSLNVTLEDLYNGKMSKLAIIRNRVCQLCDGTGASHPDHVKACTQCNGTGVRIMLNHIGPGMVQQVQTRCQSCGGRGETIPERYKCGNCGGAKVSKERKVLEVYISKGMSDGQKITFAGEANENPGTVAGDVIVVLKQQKHTIYHREGQDLYFEKTISLLEAMCGLQFCIPHLDGRQLLVTHMGSVIRPGDVKCIHREGMPVWKHSDTHGDLMIQFSVNFPDAISPVTAVELERVLGPRMPFYPPHTGEIDEVILSDLTDEQRGRRDRGEMEDDEDGGPRRVQCANQ